MVGQMKSIKTNAIKGEQHYSEKIIADIAKKEVIWIYDEVKDVEKLGSLIYLLRFFSDTAHTVRKLTEAGLNL